MRKNVFGRQFKRDRNERKALFKGLLSSLVIHGRIQTTEEKAKAIKGQAEKLVTKAKKGNGVANQLQEYLTPDSISKLITMVAPTFSNRPGGYTRIVRLGRRFNDNASMVVLEWVEEIKVSTENQKAKIKSQKEDQVASEMETPKAKRTTSKKTVKTSSEKKSAVKRGRKPKEASK